MIRWAVAVISTVSGLQCTYYACRVPNRFSPVSPSPGGDRELGYNDPMLADVLSQLLGVPLAVVDRRTLSGGCISDVSMVTIRGEDRQSWRRLEEVHGGQPTAPLVVKCNAASMASNFRCEADGLRALAHADVLRVPKVFAAEIVGDQAYLVMEWIQTGAGGPSEDRFATFGRQLAELHRATAGGPLGWPQDNFLGSAHQPNGACETWPEFVATRRIGYQIRWATDQGLADQPLQSDCDSIIQRMDELLRGREDVISLLHGDLWSGNYLFDSDGRPVLIDPAVYRGCREAEWGMIRWFGNCPAVFEQAYQDQWPMADGWRRRVGIYLLYHQLNHLNLFGASYADSCRRTAREILR